LSPGLVCPNMKKTSLMSVYRSLNEMNYEINLDETIRLKAKKALDNMLKLS
jgi:quinolinate synthase